MKEIKKIKKTFYVESELVKRIKIKSAVDEVSETETINTILKYYFNQDGKGYALKKEKDPGQA